MTTSIHDLVVIFISEKEVGMAKLDILYSDASWQVMGRIVGLTDDSVVATFPTSKTSQVLFVPKSGGNSIKLDPFPGSSLSPVNAFGDFVVVQRATARKPQTTFLLTKEGFVVELYDGKLLTKPNVFGARIDESGVYGDVRNSTEILNLSWDFDGKINLISSKNYIAGSFGITPIFGDTPVEVPPQFGGSQALFVNNGWIVGRSYEFVDGKIKKSTATSVSWIWKGSGPVQICEHPEGQKFNLVSVSPSGRFVAGLTWQNNSVNQESVVIDLLKQKTLLLSNLAECDEGGGVDFSSCRFDYGDNLFVKRITNENGVFEIVKISELSN